MSCCHRFLENFYVDVHISKVTLEEAADIKEFVDAIKAERKLKK